MNRTKKKIFETAMDLFAKKGYDSASIEEITAVAGVAKGTLYYYFKSKEEILKFLISEGLELLEHSLQIKERQAENFEDKIYAIILVLVKVATRYENLINVTMTELCGNSSRNEFCRECVYKCVDVVEKVLIEGKEAGKLKEDIDTKKTAFEIFSIICSVMMYRYRCPDEFDIIQTAEDFTKPFLESLLK